MLLETELLHVPGMRKVVRKYLMTKVPNCNHHTCCNIYQFCACCNHSTDIRHDYALSSRTHVSLRLWTPPARRNLGRLHGLMGHGVVATTQTSLPYQIGDDSCWQWFRIH
eukprot:COSAG02_NODE_8067_length_2722_cov_2.277545_4_plen_109_part_01